ncbi:MAG: hypothetical protein M0Z47_10760 [Actinomycetota bacterium]|nr:hypothetical protein [Actinomycetota bacterium]
MQTWEKVGIAAAGAAAAAFTGYEAYRYFTEGPASATPIPAPTGLTLTPQAAVSRTDAPILAQVDPYTGSLTPTYNWYHYYLKGGKLYPRLVGSTSSPEFLFGRETATGVQYPVAPGSLYTVGVQITAGGVSSPITVGHATAKSFTANSSQSGGSTSAP